jgi:hypothetical protein
MGIAVDTGWHLSLLGSGVLEFDIRTTINIRAFTLKLLFSFQIPLMGGSQLVPRPEEASSPKLTVWKLPLNSDYVRNYTVHVQQKVMYIAHIGRGLYT